MFAVLNDLVVLIRNIIILIAVLRFFGYAQYTENIDIELSDTALAEKRGTICLYIPTAAATELGKNNAKPTWQEILNQLFLTQGILMGDVTYIQYNEVNELFQSKTRCNYNIYVVHGPDDLSYTAQLLLNKWECVKYDFNIYYYEQQKGNYLKFKGSGVNCNAVACPVDISTLGIGCVSTDANTYELVTQNDAFIDLIDQQKYRMNITGTQSINCYYEDCKLIGPDYSSYLIVASTESYFRNVDGDLDPLTPAGARMTRINFKKWWQVFYQIVQIINDLVNRMTKKGTYYATHLPR